MKARVIFINEKEMQATGNQYALASGVYTEQFDSSYVRVEDVIDFVQLTQNAAAEEMIKMQEKTGADGTPADVTAYQSEWRTLNFLLSELKNIQSK